MSRSDYGAALPEEYVTGVTDRREGGLCRPIEDLGARDCYQHGPWRLYQYDPKGNAQARTHFHNRMIGYPCRLHRLYPVDRVTLGVR